MTPVATPAKPAKALKTVKIKTLGIGARFFLPGYKNNAVFEIISRARKAGGGTPGTFIKTVKGLHKPNANEGPLGSPEFDINFEVVPVGRAKKTVEAIDLRDQPEEVETIEQVAAREGVTLPDEEDEDE